MKQACLIVLVAPLIIPISVYSQRASNRLNCVLTNDPGLGVARHVDAGYEEAEQTAREKGVKVPMLESAK